MNVMKTALAASVVLALAGCGGGGSEAGASFPNGTTDGDVETEVTTGVINQSKMTYAVDKYALDWLNLDDEAAITVYVANTIGAPVVAGQRVYFAAEAGFLSANSCVLTGQTSSTGEQTFSTCSVKFRPNVGRPVDGYTTIVAYVQGEEAYADVDGNGRYTAGEAFVENGQVFRDDDNDLGYSTFDVSTGSGDALKVASTISGSQACRADAGVIADEDSLPLSVPNTCDGVWGRATLSMQIVLPVSFQSSIGIEALPDAGNGSKRVLVFSSSGPADAKVAPVAGTTITTTVTGATGCTVTPSPNKVDNNIIAPLVVTLNASGTCDGASVQVTATSGSYAPSLNVDY